MKRRADISASARIEAAAARWVARRDAGMSPAEERELQRWIDADPRHRLALGFYDSAWAALAQPSRSGAGAQLEAQLAVLAGRRRQRRIMAGSAAAIILLGFSAAMWNRLPFPSGATMPTAVVMVPPRQVLPDGSWAELKGSARISVDYTVSSRRVRLTQGEAYFSVQEDSARPFVVTAGGVEVRAIGTAFSVQRSATAVEVLVTDGRVAVAKSSEEKPNPVAVTQGGVILTNPGVTTSASSSARAEAGPPKMTPPWAVTPAALATIDAGKRVVVDFAASEAIPEVSVVPPAELEERLAWRSARLEFTRTPLGEAFTLLNQHAPPSAPRLAIGDAVAGSMRVSGVFRADNTDAFVLLLEGAFGLKAERSGNTITVRKISTDPKPY